MEKELSGREKRTIIKSIVNTGYKKIYDEAWKNQVMDSAKSYHVEVWIQNEHLYFFFSGVDQNVRGVTKMYSCMRSDAETLSNIENEINFDTYDKGLVFSELIDGNFDHRLIEDLVLVENQLNTAEVMLLIKKCKTLKNYVSLLKLQEELVLRHFFGLQEKFDYITKKSREKLDEYKKCMEALENKLLVSIPEKLELSEIAKALKNKDAIKNKQNCGDETNLIELTLEEE